MNHYQCDCWYDEEHDEICSDLIVQTDLVNLELWFCVFFLELYWLVVKKWTTKYIPSSCGYEDFSSYECQKNDGW